MVATNRSFPDATATMKILVTAALIAVTILGFGSGVVSACGDKFLTVGRGVRFQHAYAAIHPASILIVLPPKSVKDAAVRDARLVTALKMAGHRVETVQKPANLMEALARSPRHIVLVERADAPALRDAVASSGQPKASIISVLEGASSDATLGHQPSSDYVLRTPQTLSQILNLLDDVMKARRDSVRHATD